MMRRLYIFMWFMKILAPMAWRLSSPKWEVTYSANGFTVRRATGRVIGSARLKGE